MNLEKLNLEKLKEDLIPVLVSGINGLIAANQKDVEAYARAISLDLLESQIIGDEITEGQLMDQLLLLAEIQQIKVRNESWGLLTRIVSAVFKAAVAGVLAVI